MSGRHAFLAEGDSDSHPADRPYPPRSERGLPPPAPPLIYLYLKYTDWWGAALPYTPSIPFQLVLHSKPITNFHVPVVQSEGSTSRSPPVYVYDGSIRRKE